MTVGCSKSTVPSCQRQIAEDSNIQSHLTRYVMSVMLQALEYRFVSGVHQIAVAVNGPKFGPSLALNILTLNTVLYIHNCPTNALVCNKTLIQMSHTKTIKITPTFFDHQMIIIRELFDPG
jgi:hypothetical protein